MNKPRLSICVPIRNDVEELRMTLNSISSKLELLPKEIRCQIEVLLSDNDSTDGSYTEMENFVLTTPKARCYLQEKNVGFRGNLEFLIGRASGDYVFFMGGGATFHESLNLVEFVSRLPESNSSQIFYRSEIYDEETGTSGTSPQFDESYRPTYSAAPFPIWPREKLMRIVEEFSPGTSGDWWPQVEWALILGTQIRSEYTNAIVIKGYRPRTSWATSGSAIDAIHSLINTLKHYSHLMSIDDSYVDKEIKANITSLPKWYFYLRVRRGVKGLFKKYRDSLALHGFFSFSNLQTLLVLCIPVFFLDTISRVIKSLFETKQTL